VPRSSESCQRVCEILLLYELLRRRRPDLRLEEAGSFLSLVGRRGRRSLPPVAKSPTRALIQQGIASARKEGLRPKEPLDIVVAALELAPEVFPSFGPGHELTEARVAAGIEDILGGTTPRAFPSPALAEESEVGFWRKRLDSLVKPLRAFRSSDRAQDLACGIALPFAIKAITVPSPIVKAGGALVLLGCGMEFSDLGPEFIRGLPIGLPEATRTPKALTGVTITPTPTPTRVPGD